MKKLCIILLCMLSIVMSACGKDMEKEPVSEGDRKVEAQETAQNEQENTGDEESSRMLVAYFTYGENANIATDVDVSSSASVQVWNNEITGNTGVLAHMIQSLTNADLFSIKTSSPYPDTYDATISQGQKENEDNVRPNLSTHIENLDQYDTIFIGYPNWWYDMPMAIYTFFEEYDLSGKTIVPFSTSGGSGFSDTLDTIRALEPNAIIQEGLTISAENVTEAQTDITEWLRYLNYVK